MVISLALMVMDHRQQHLETVRSVLSAITYPLHFIVSLPQSGGRWLSETFATRNRLAQAQMKKLKIYGGSEHPHESQNPVPYSA